MRRAAVIAAAVLACVAVGSFVVGRGGGGPADRSHARDVPRSEPATGALIRIVWSRPVRGWPSQITADDGAVIAVSGGRFVAALDPGDGTVEWEAEVPGWLSPFLEPALGADAVLLSAGDRFVVLDRADGAPRWEAPAGGEARGVALLPTAGAGVVAVTATLDPEGNGLLSGRDAGDGQPWWTVTGTGVIDAHLAVDPESGLVLAIWQTPTAATVRAIDGASGALRWEQEVEPMVASPVVAGDVVIVAAGDGDYRANVHALGLADGRVRWTTPVPASFEPDLVPGVDPDVATVAVQDHLGTVSLLDLRHGTVRWQAQTGLPALGGRALVTPDAVVVHDEGRQLVVIDRARGRVRAHWREPDGVPEGMALAGSRVLVAWRWTEPGRIDALAIEKSPSRP